MMCGLIYDVIPCLRSRTAIINMRWTVVCYSCLNLE